MDPIGISNVVGLLHEIVGVICFLLRFYHMQEI